MQSALRNLTGLGAALSLWATVSCNLGTIDTNDTNVSLIAICGDTRADAGEACDDGNTASGDYCSSDCKTVTGRCGDGLRQTNEACDDGHASACGTCNATCSGPGAGPTCGDGVVCEDVEVCDDGNTASGDYCAPDCKSITGWCGDGIPQTNEACDDGRETDCGPCDATCTGMGSGATCGDSIICEDTEVCDDGNVDAGDYCSADCTEVTGSCGDDTRQTNEACDDGRTSLCGACNETCTGVGLGSSCGDSTVCEDTEVCDDGNTASGDYCASDCKAVTGRCADGIVQTNEACEPGKLGGATCESLGFGPGTLACKSDCLAFDHSGCTERPCTPDCTDRQCGDNGCGASCGECESPALCDEARGRCVSGCTPGEAQCTDSFGFEVCGPDVSDPDKTTFGWRVACEPENTCLGGACSGQCITPQILLVVDRSSSMTGARWDFVRGAVLDFATRHQSYARFGLRMFPSGDACAVGDIVPMLLDNAAAIEARLAEPSAGAQTPLAAALQGILSAYGDPNQGQSVVLITDGDETCASDRDAVLDEAARLARDGVNTFAVAVSTQANSRLLARLAAAGRTDSTYSANSRSELDSALWSIYQRTGACYCGNNQIDIDEVCDDGNSRDGDYCSGDCSQVTGRCADGIKQNNEACDDGRKTQCGPCNATCTAAGAGSTCGDGVRCEDTEFCDDGHTTGCGSCNATCKGAGEGSECGDGQWCEDTEACDDGRNTDCGPCNATCTAAGTGSTCGDGVRCTDTEFCDDGHTTACGPCNATCTAWGFGTCGDGVRCEDNEACDDGHKTSCGPCNATCTGPGSGSACGDAVRCEDTEFCDDGRTTACGSCNATCTGAGSGSVCGDAVRCEDTEACDDGHKTACGSCNSTCTGAGSGSTCGDGARCEDTEACDDGHTTACGPCNATCAGPGSGSACGDGVRCEDTESCDDGHKTACGSCNATCTGVGTGSVCGDWKWCEDTEACDDGHTTDCGPCNAACTGPGTETTCGDGARCEDTEACDDHNTGDGDYCSGDCSAVTGRCGDGTKQTNEACDDGNTVSGDYCSSDCQTVTGRCGDKIKQTNEVCDDGNAASGDNCSADCQVWTGMVVAAWPHSCALRGTGVGTVKCWGENYYGQLGLGDTYDRGDNTGEMGASLPLVSLGTGRTVAAIASMYRHACALLDDGSVKCWGDNWVGQLGLGDSDDRGDDPGEMGDELPAVSLGTGRTAKAIATGKYHTCVLLDDGSVKCWGYSNNGQLGLGDTVIRGDDLGEMGDKLPAVSLGTGRTAKAVAAGGDCTCVILDNGSVKCWGFNDSGQLGLGDTNTRGNGPDEMGDNLPVVSLGTGRKAEAIAVGGEFTCAILDNGSVKCWGNNWGGQLGLGNTDDRGDGPGEMGDKLPAASLGIGRTARAIAAGYGHTCAILDNSSLKCWGYGGYGQLGLGDTSKRGDLPGEMGDNLPAVNLGTGRKAAAVAAGLYHTCALLDDVSVKCWGYNEYGQLGLGDTATRGDAAGEMGDALPAVDLWP